jgi:general secretion pathway protein I
VLLSENNERNPGFSLLEVMVALSIISIVLVSVYRLHSQTLEMNQQLRFQTIAPLLAQTKLAEAEYTPVDDLASDSGTFGDQYPGYNWQLDIKTFESDLLETVAENLKRIEVTVSYHDIHQYTLETYRFMPQ